MDFNFSEETIMLQNATARYLKEKCSGQLVKEILKSEKGFSEKIWQDMAEMGWLGLIHEERYGGSGGGFLDLFVLFQEIGKVQLPSPFFCSAFMSGLMLSEFGSTEMKNRLLPGVVSGAEILTCGVLNRYGAFDQRRPETAAVPAQIGSYLLSGTKLLVPYAHVADGFLVCANVNAERGGPTLFLVPPGRGITLSPLEMLTGGKAFAVTFDGVAVSDADRVGDAGRGSFYIDRMMDRAVAVKCAEMLGGLERVLELTVSYAKERRQFDKPLASLQVIQHYCVDLYTHLETARLISYQAASLLNDGVAGSKEVAMAKAWCNEAYKKSTWISHQIHGAIGFCEEHDLHLFYKHAKASELEWGDTHHHRRLISEMPSDGCR